jgi:cell division protein FtsI (penicillin-binding protein 3)
VSAIEARLVYLQVVASSRLASLAEQQHERSQPLPAARGDILDRRGQVLATSAEADTIVADPSEIQNPAEVVARLCEVFADCTSRERELYIERLGSSTRLFAYLRRQVAPEIAHRVRLLEIEGVGAIKESKRFYPNKELGSHVIGFVGVDGKGLAGIEAVYDDDIRGEDGAVLTNIDGGSRAFSNRIDRQPTSGLTLELTLDEYLQHMAERELSAGIHATRAAAGCVVILEPQTGEILAMASAPRFNPNVYSQSPPEARRNRCVQDAYEPGSVFKVITAAAALEERVLPLDALIDLEGGRLRIGKRVVYDDHSYNSLTFADVIVKSSNVGAVKLAFLMGTERFAPYVSLFGFGQRTSTDFHGENPGMPPHKWTDDALTSVAFGHEVAVTPLQMVASVSAIANGGRLMEPRVVRALHGEDGRTSIGSKMVRRVVSPGTATSLTRVLEEVVERGTATGARIRGFRVAGKTGTARKIVDGRYSRTDYNASFVGFVPSREPVATIIVMIDSPRTSIYGGSVAAPVFKRIAEATLRYLGVPPTVLPSPSALIAVDRHEAPERQPPVVQAQAFPVAHRPNGAPSDILPDLTGLSAREAMRALFELGLTPRMTGNGFVTSQDPEPGAPIHEGALVEVALERWVGRTARGVAQP